LELPVERYDTGTPTFLWTILQSGHKNAVDFREFHNIKLQVHQHQVALRPDIVLSFDFLDTENNEHYVLVVISTLQNNTHNRYQVNVKLKYEEF
jgi:hypothetical protein